MKQKYFFKNIAFGLLMAVPLLMTNGVQAQINKTQKAAKNKRTVIRTDTTSNPVTVISPHKDITINFTSCQVSGNHAIMEFLITNTGPDLKEFRIYGSISGSKAFDELGNEYGFSNQFGNKKDNYGRMASNTLSQNIKVKVITTIDNINSNAKQFSQITIKCNSYNSSYNVNGDIVFKNVPIMR